MVVVMLMVFLVHVLLLSATGRLVGGQSKSYRVILGALAGTVFAGLSVLPNFRFLHHLLWRMCALTVSSLLTFGFNIRKWILFSLLHLSLGGISGSQKEAGFMLLGAFGITFACVVVGKEKQYVPVELSYRGRTVMLTALRDTGNTLRDPFTGKQVLIISADMAQMLTGLSASKLRDPIGAMGSLPGLRLIPYQTVGNTGFLLALLMENVKIGNKRENTLVAFSPQVFESRYQALTGGFA